MLYVFQLSIHRFYLHLNIYICTPSISFIHLISLDMMPHIRHNCSPWVNSFTNDSWAMCGLEWQTENLGLVSLYTCHWKPIFADTKDFCCIPFGEGWTYLFPVMFVPHILTRVLTRVNYLQIFCDYLYPNLHRKYFVVLYSFVHK